MKAKKRNLVECAMHYRQIVILITCCLMAFGIYGLTELKKNEFPDFTIRQGVVVAVYPGATAAEIEEQVAKPLENYIFSFKEVKKSKTSSTSKDGIVVIQVQLNDNLENKDEFWSKFKHGVNQFKSQLPIGVLAVQVKDDFGDTSAVLVTMESKDKTYRELNDYMDNLQDQLRTVESVGRMSVYGMQKEQISIYLDNDQLSHYGISDKSLAMTLFTKGFTTSAGRVKTNKYVSPVYVGKSLNTLRDVQEIIVFSDPMGNVVKLKDVARVVKEYPIADSYITNNGKKCLLLSVEMKKGKNIVEMGELVNNEITEFEKSLPSDVNLFKITDQSKVVGDSVETFLHELLIAICAVIIVVMLLLPLRVAMVAASTIPISIFISLGLFYAFGIELNTVTLAALIVTLGMIVDNSIVIIDSYLEKISEGESRWHASIESATHFFKSIFSATLAISVTFFPFLFTMTGMTKDFLRSFPWAITLILLISLLIAELLVPFMQFYFIRKPGAITLRKNGKKSFSFLDVLQRSYNWLLDKCFAYPRTTIGIGALSVVVGAVMMMQIPQKLMPTAERNQFAVEIYLPTGTALEKTSLIADSLEHILQKDKRVVSVASFKGTSSPRFQNSYAPQIGGSNYAQFIVNTTDNDATEKILDEYLPRYSNYFPEAIVRFKQLGYSEAVYPIEVRVSGNDLALLKKESDTIVSILRTMPQLNQVRTNFNEPLVATRVELNEDESIRLGLTNALLESTMGLHYGSGAVVGSVWEKDYDINVVLKSNKADSACYEDLKDELIPVNGGLAYVPLGQVAKVVPVWEDGQIVRRNGVRTITIMADLQRGNNAIAMTAEIQKKLSTVSFPKGITVDYGGEYEENNEQTPNIMAALCIAIVIIFFILIIHFKRITTAALILCCLSLCLFGTAIGCVIQGIDFSVTCTMGIVSLMGILVRNGIIMIDYAEELRSKEKMTAHQAIYHSAQRRMRPIFLTSAAASMGVIPMILGGSGLWMPMGTVIFYGTLITMFFILTVMPVSYWLVMSGTTKKRLASEALEKN
ncbi:MAG: efflux RND transporter permease subunit [Muribaculaceae bacterium]|nr:efflux RND transporter permease subunit [Muribaculaceae bacterium]